MKTPRRDLDQTRPDPGLQAAQDGWSTTFRYALLLFIAKLLPAALLLLTSTHVLAGR